MTSTVLKALAGASGEALPSLGLAAWPMVAIPLLSAAILLLAGRRSDKWGHILGVAAPTASFAVAAVAFVDLLGRPSAARGYDVDWLAWINGGLFVDLGFRVDQLSLTFALLVTFVGTLIHIYAVAYMAQDRDRRRFFAYLNLFVAAMLLLVLADSYLLLFVGWEGVGLASYLLIGFWNQRLDYAVAAKK
ncbi:MAG: NADH-quinone oxidoreductase subunit L, partial [Bifidobacteriaceae bacterium]|nr:NADH-quinone oxidoreductase subunit L [Bifidobacteriaceae bacterium]